MYHSTLKIGVRIRVRVTGLRSRVTLWIGIGTHDRFITPVRTLVESIHEAWEIRTRGTSFVGCIVKCLLNEENVRTKAGGASVYTNGRWR